MTILYQESFFQRNRGLISSAVLKNFYDMQNNGVTFSYVEEIVPEIGGPLYLRSHYALIKDCFFIENNGNLGGAIFLGKQLNLRDHQFFQMERCIFFNNTGGQSGCIEFALDLQYFQGVVVQSYFNFNRAGCNLFFC